MTIKKFAKPSWNMVHDQTHFSCLICHLDDSMVMTWAWGVIQILSIFGSHMEWSTRLEIVDSHERVRCEKIESMYFRVMGYRRLNRCRTVKMTSIPISGKRHWQDHPRDRLCIIHRGKIQRSQHRINSSKVHCIVSKAKSLRSNVSGQLTYCHGDHWSSP